jgi:transcriptional regulator with XRE-family HTH domain
METFGEYLDRVMRQKNLTSKQVASKCSITNSYISRMMKGKAGNLSVDTIVKLSKGLEIDPHEVFTAASGIPPEAGPDPLFVLDAIQKLLLNSQGFELLQDWLNLPGKDQKTVAEVLRLLNEKKHKSKRKKK